MDYNPKRLRRELKEKWGLIVYDEDVSYETDDALMTKSGMGWNRSVEDFWRNRRFDDPDNHGLNDNLADTALTKAFFELTQKHAKDKTNQEG